MGEVKNESILAYDGTRWIYSPEFDIWNGFQLGEDRLWRLTPFEMEWLGRGRVKDGSFGVADCVFSRSWHWGQGIL